MYDKLTRALCAPEPGDQGGAGAPPPADPKTPPPADPAPDSGDDKAAAELAQLKAERDKLKAEQDAAEKAKSKAKGDKTAAELSAHEQELAKLREEIASLKSGALSEARTAAFERLGVLPEYRDLVPSDMDPRTEDGAKKLEKFLSERPGMMRSRVPEPPKVDMQRWGPKVQKVLEGKERNPMITEASLRKMDEAARAAGRR